MLIPVTTLGALPAMALEMSTVPADVPFVLPRRIVRVNPVGRIASRPAVIFTVLPKFWVMLYVVELSKTEVSASKPAVPVVIVSGTGLPDVDILYTAPTVTLTL